MVTTMAQQSYPTVDPLGSTDDETSGKSVVFTYRYVEDRHTHGKEHFDVVTDDGSVYSWSRFDDAEPFTFEARHKPNGQADTARRPLPQSVREVVDDADVEILYR